MTVNAQSGPADDFISTAASALRRLNFKSGRMSARAAAAAAKGGGQVVPKLVVMGSSTASSEATINTSTESGNTILTTVTATDGDVTEDSLDLEQHDILDAENVFTDGAAGRPPLVRSPTLASSSDDGTPQTALAVGGADGSMEEPPASPRNRGSRRQRSPRFHADRFTYDEKHIARYRERARATPPPLPDLRVDFFSERVDGDRRGSVCLDKCLREVGAALDAAHTSPVNVTPNPLSCEHHHQPQAAQYAHGVSELSTAPRRDLLDVAAEDMIVASSEARHTLVGPHHSRSQSVKTPGRGASGGGRPNYLCLPQQRSRVASMPNTGVEEEYYRLRHFSITGKGVINRGDSLKSRRSRSNNSVASSNNSSAEHIPSTITAAVATSAVISGTRTSAPCSLASSRESSTSNPGPTPYRVLMLGGPAVGKSSLVSQFMTSEYLHAYDTSLDDESHERSVSVLLAGEESELTFIDHSCADLPPESSVARYPDLHAYCVVYSSADRASLAVAERALQALWTSDAVSTRAVILVANKADLVRSRVVSTDEGKSMATSYDCKYIETSVGINHNVDELLVGILTQIRLKLENPERTRDLFRKRSGSRRNLQSRSRSPSAAPAGTAPAAGGTPLAGSPRKCRGTRTSASLKVRGLLGRVWARDSKSKSCENLHVL